MHIPFMCVCIDIVYHIFLQQRHITHQILAIGAIALRHMHLLPRNAFENLPKDRYSLESGPRPTSTCHWGGWTTKKHCYSGNCASYKYPPLFFVLMIRSWAKSCKPKALAPSCRKSGPCAASPQSLSF